MLEKQEQLLKLCVFEGGTAGEGCGGDILAFVPVCWVNICNWENCVHSLHLSEELAVLLRRAALRVFLGGNLYLFLCAFFLRSVIFHGRRGWCTRRGHVQTNPHHIPCCGS